MHFNLIFQNIRTRTIKKLIRSVFNKKKKKRKTLISRLHFNLIFQNIRTIIYNNNYDQFLKKRKKKKRKKIN